MIEDFRRYHDGKQAARRPGIGPSGVDTCYRKLAFEYLEVEPTDTVSKEAAELGTMYHLAWSSMIGSMYQPEQRECDVEVTYSDLLRPGSLDDIDWVNRRILDLKSLNARSYQYWLNNGPSESYQHQLAVYAYGVSRQHPGDWTLAILAINRETGEQAEYEWPYDPAEGARLVAKMEERHLALTAARDDVAAGSVAVGEALERFPREGRGSGFPCDWCPFQKACWNKPTSPTRTQQSETVHDDPDAIGFWINEYLEAAAESSKADGRKKDARTFLAGIEGQYPLPDGGVGKVSYTGGKVGPPTPDCEAMVETLQQLGVEIPMRDGATTPLRISVNRVKR